MKNQAYEYPGQPIIQIKDLVKSYSDKNNPVLKGITTEFKSSTFTAIMGPSGSGKSTLLNCSAGLDTPTSGTVTVNGVVLSKLKEPKLTKKRRKNIGFIFQSFNLIESLTVWENVMLAQKLNKQRVSRNKVKEILHKIGLGGHIHSYPEQLSGGQQQRVSIARALANDTHIIFGDEPTGALDIKTGNEVLSLLREAVDEYGKTIVMVTHDPSAASWADRVLFFADGQINSELSTPTVEQVSQRMMELTNR